VDTNHELTRKRPYGGGRGRFQDYDIRGGVGPLFLATMNNDHESMQLLLAHGAEVDLRNVMQMTPLMIAAGMRGTGGGGGGGGGGGAGGGGAAGGDRALKSIEILLDAGANINAQVTGSRNRTAVLMAYVAGRDQEGKTGLMTAAENGQERIVKLLLDRGADLALRDATGKAAIDFARLPVAELSDDASEPQKQTRARLVAGRKAAAALIEAALK
jgi:ankyrin repeat protein